MLEAILYCTDRAIETGLRDRLCAFLPRILAEALSVPGDQLVPEDVVIRYGSGEEWVSPRGDDFRVRIETEIVTVWTRTGGQRSHWRRSNCAAIFPSESLV